MTRVSNTLAFLGLVSCASLLHGQTLPDWGSGLPPEKSVIDPAMFTPNSKISVLSDHLSPGELEKAERLDTILQELLAETLEKGGIAPDLKSYKLAENTPYEKYNLVQDNAPIVDITITGDAAAAVASLKSLQGVTVNAVASTPGYTLVSAAIHPAKLLDAAALPGVRQLIASGMMTDGEESIQKAQGSVSNQAEEELEVDDLWRVFPNNDAGGLEVGVLSDSINQVNGIIGDGFVGIDESQNTNDLPGDAFINVIQDGGSSDSDEGRAMMELIYDLAPGCDMYNFATANGGEANFASNITALGNAGCDVIVDDIIYYGEPMFQDGVVAVSAENYVGDGGVYFSSAGNRGLRGRQFEWNNPTGNAWMDFSPGDEILRMTIAGPSGNPARNNSMNLVLQWSEPWGNATVDLELILYDSGVDNVLASTSTNNVNGNPYERLTYTNATGAAQNVQLAIRLDSGDPTGLTVKLINFDASVSFNEYAGNFGGAVNPHAAANNVMGMAAAPFWDRDNAEGFSSRGPHRVFFLSNGNPIPFVDYIDRNKPDFISVDGTETTFFGNQINDGNTIPNFFGTSASAPNAAAVALLLIDAAGTSGSLDENDIDAIFKTSSIDIGGDGFDTTNGFGRIHALGAGVLAAGRGTDEFTLYPNQFGDARLEANLYSDSDNDSFLYGQSTANADVDISVVETSNFDMDPMVTIINAETKAPIHVAYDASSAIDNVDSTFRAVNSVIHYGRVLSETSFSGGASNYRLEINGPSPFVVTKNFTDSGQLFYSSTLTKSPVDVDHVRFTVPDDITEEERLSVSLQSFSHFDGEIILWDSTGEEVGREGSRNGIGARDITEFTNIVPGAEYVVGIAPYKYNWVGGTSSSYNLSVFAPRYLNQPNQLAIIPLVYDDVVRPNPVTGRDLRPRKVLDEGELLSILFVPFGNNVDLIAYVPSNVYEEGEISAGLYTTSGERLDGEGLGANTIFDDVNSRGAPLLHRIYGGYDEIFSPAVPGIAMVADYYEAPAPRTRLSPMKFSTPDEPYIAKASETNNLDTGENGYHVFVWPAGAYTGEGIVQAGILSGENLDPLLRVFDSNGNLLAESNIWGSGVSEEIRSKPAAPIFEPGETYYVHVQGDIDEGVSRLDGTQKGNYTLSVRALLPDQVPTPTPTPSPTPAVESENWIIK